MKTTLPIQNRFLKSCANASLFLLAPAFLVCLSNPSIAAVKPLTARAHRNTSKVSKPLFTAPTLSYSSPQTYTNGVTISPLTPTSTGVAAAAYSAGIATVGAGAGFSTPRGIAADAAGNIYMADFGGNKVWKIPVGGGAPFQIGSGFSGPDGLGLDAAGNLYISDYGTGSIKKIPFGSNTPVVVCAFSQPFGIAVSPAGDIYVADNVNKAIKKIPAGTSTPVLVRGGFGGPIGVALDPAGNIYFGDAVSTAINKIPADGSATVLLGTGFNHPYGVAVDPAGNIIVGDASNGSVKEILASGGSTITLNNTLGLPTGVTTDPAGNIFISDYNGSAVKKISPIGGFYTGVLPIGLTIDETTGTISGTPTVTQAATDYVVTAYNASGNGTATINIHISAAPVPAISYNTPQTFTVGTAISALSPTSSNVAAPAYSTTTAIFLSGLSGPRGVVLDAAGNTYVADAGNATVKKFPVGGGAAVTIGSGFVTPTGVAVDAAGNVYVVDYGNNTLKKFPPNAGPPQTLSSSLNHPMGLAIDAAGNLYVADNGSGWVKEYFVNTGSLVDMGSNYSAPVSICLDAAGNIYFGTVANGPIKMLPVGGAAVVSLGSGFVNPYGLTVDVAGNVYLTDQGSNTVKEIPAGNGNVITLNSNFSQPYGITTDGKGNLFVADYNSQTIKQITPKGGYFINALPLGLTFNSATGSIVGTAIVASPATNYTVTAYNNTAFGTATINIATVLPAAPAISYSSPQGYVLNQVIAPLAPVISGTVSAFGYAKIPTVVSSAQNKPYSVAVDAAGNIYVANGSGLVQKIPAGGGAPVNLTAGSVSPEGIAVDAAGNVYVSDFVNGVIRKLPAGGGFAVNAATGLNGPTGIAVDAAGNIYVAEFNASAVREVPVGGGAYLTLGSGFNHPFAVALDAAGNVYVADSFNSAVKKIPVGGGAPVTLGSGFISPYGVAVDVSGNVFVNDRDANAVKEIPVGGGSVFTLGQGFNAPYGVAVDVTGNILVADYFNNSVKEIKLVGGFYVNPALPSGLSLNSGTGVISGTPSVVSPATNYVITGFNAGGNGSATVNIVVNQFPPPVISYSSPKVFTVNTAITNLTPTNTGGPVSSPGYNSLTSNLGSGFSGPTDVAVDAAGNVYVADYTNNAVKKIPVGGGSPVILASGLSHPTGVAVDGSGYVYFSEEGTGIVYKVPVGGGAHTNVASGFNNPYGLAIDALGNIYVADYGNNAVKEIPVGGGPVVAIGSGFSGPLGLAVDAAGNVYVADYSNNAVKKIPVGGGAPITIGAGFSHPADVAVDFAGNVFVADNSNNAIKEIPVGGGATFAVASGLSGPFGVAVDGAGNVYEADYLSSTVKKIVPNGGYYADNLPVGLSIDKVTGVISGTPTAISPATNYNITAYNSAGGGAAVVNIKIASNNANLSALVLSTGTLTPAFTAGAINYTTNVSSATASITVTPTVASSGATVKVNGVAVASGAASAAIPLVVGTNTITTVVTAQNGTTTKTYTLTVNRLQGYAANLVSLKLNNGTLTPVFNANTISYTAYVASTIATLTVTPTLRDSLASVTVNGVTVATGTASAAIPLAFGADTITTVVTAIDGVTTKTYTVIVTRQTSTNANLANLVLSAGILTPVFAPATAGYTASVANAVTSLQVTPTTADANATVKVNGVTVASGMASAVLPLAIGANVIHVVVTAQSATVKTYTVTVTRAQGSNADLSAFAVSSGTLTPVFAAATMAYTDAVTSATSSIKVTPTASDANATIMVNGVSVASGAASASLPLVTGPNTITTVVTAPDGTTTKTYTLTVTRTSSNANLSNLVISAGTLTPVFAAGTSNYTASVGNTITSLTVTPTTSDAGATVTVNGVTVASGSASAAIPLVVGSNVIIAKVTAFDGTAKTYKVTITRAASVNANLAGLSVSVGTLTPVFASATTSYTDDVISSTVSIKITPTTSDASATVTVNGTTVASGTASASLPLSTGNNTITTVVTAGDGTTKKTYTLTVVRTSSNANLSNMAISAGTLSPVFTAGTSSYTAAVSNATTTITVTPTTSDAAATVTVNNNAVASGTASPALPLIVGSNVISTKVTAFDGTVKTYKITVTRATGPLMVVTKGGYTTYGVNNPDESIQLNSDAIKVHQGLSPNGDGQNDVLIIDGISGYPDNTLSITDRSGQLVFETRGYDNATKTFDGHSNKNGRMQLPGTYFYSLDYKAGDQIKHKTGFIILKY